MAACLCFLMPGGWGFWQSPIGTVWMQINPDVQMEVNRFDRESWKAATEELLLVELDVHL